MDLFGLVRITWLPGEKNDSLAAPPSLRSPSAPERPEGLEPSEPREPSDPQEPQDAGSQPGLAPEQPDPGPLPEPSPPTQPSVTELPGTVGADAPAAVVEPDVVWSLIGLADDLADLAGRDWTGESAARTLQLVQRRVDTVLAESGVQALADEGPVVPARHHVVGAQPADADGAAGSIAATVRRGYMRGDQLIRPQLVVAYIAADPSAPKEGETHAERS